MHRIKLIIMAALIAVACRPPVARWQTVSQDTGCSPALLARTAAFDSTDVLALAGSYRLVQVDTARGWLALTGGPPRQWPVLDLWAADSVHAHFRRSFATQELIPATRPIVGRLRGSESRGFTDDNPQAEVAPHRETYLIVRFSPQPMTDASIWELPIAHRGDWGFGGYYRQHDYVVPVGPDGEALGQRAGFYCAFRQPQ